MAKRTPLETGRRSRAGPPSRRFAMMALFSALSLAACGAGDDPVEGRGEESATAAPPDAGDTLAGSRAEQKAREKLAERDAAHRVIDIAEADRVALEDIPEVYIAHLVRCADAVEAVRDRETAYSAIWTVTAARDQLEKLERRVDALPVQERVALFRDHYRDIMRPKVRYTSALRNLNQDGKEYMAELASATREPLPELEK